MLEGKWQKAEGEVKTIGEKGAKVLFPLFAFLTLAVDQLSKYIVSSTLNPGQSWNPIPSLEKWISITYITNTGAAFGLFPQQGLIFMTIAILVVIAILIYQRHLSAERWLVRLSLGLQLGGALGNLSDRIRSFLAAEGDISARLSQAHVVDFIDLKIWPVFNLADTAIVLGVAILALHLLLNEE
ncbi:MAG: signal peptidase II [Anaerolineae bacterium]